MTPLLTIARGDASGVSEPRRMIARSEAEWQTLWALHAGPDAALPAIDFAQVIAAAAFAGEKPSAGHSIEISAAPSSNGVVHLAVSERAPGPGMVAAAMITSPFHIVAVSRDAGDVRWEEVGGRASEVGGRGPEVGGRSPEVAPGAPATATGMEPRNASALAYLAGPFSGAMILFAESTHPDVRFHAWQSIVGLGTLGLLVIVSSALVFLSVFVSAAAVWVMVILTTVLWGVLLIVWALCLWKALSGERWKLPIAGDYAERLAGQGIKA
jgi:uncharacterized membrane protein